MLKSIRRVSRAEEKNTSHNLPLALCVEINPVYRPVLLVETNIIEAFKTSSVESAHAVVWDQKFFLPPHEYIVSLCPPWNLDVHLSRLLLVGAEGRKFRPVLVVYEFS